MFNVQHHRPTTLSFSIEDQSSDTSSSLSSCSPTPATPTTKRNLTSGIWSVMGERMASVFRCLIQPRILLLAALFLNNGYSQMVVSAQVTRQVAEVKNVGLMMAGFAITEVITTIVLARLADRAGHRVIGLVGVLAEVAGCVMTCVMNTYQGWTIALPPILFAIMDTVFQTEVR